MKEYANDELVVFWGPEGCVHSRNCVMGLPKVFNRSKGPWIDMDGATSGDIMKTVDQCHSGALSYKSAAGNRAGENEAIGNECGEKEKMMRYEAVSTRVTRMVLFSPRQRCARWPGRQKDCQLGPRWALQLRQIQETPPAAKATLGQISVTRDLEMQL